jgi:DUF1365 family protein
VAKRRARRAADALRPHRRLQEPFVPAPVAAAPPTDAPCVILGEVMHRRSRPTHHAFTYPAFCLRLPLSRLPALGAGGIRHNRRGLVSFHERDHGPRDGSSLETWIRDLLRREGIAAEGEVVLHAFPRILGYVFNPVSFWVCHDREGGVRAVLAEVEKTIGERHQ